MSPAPLLDHLHPQVSKSERLTSASSSTIPACLDRSYLWVTRNNSVGRRQLNCSAVQSSFSWAVAETAFPRRPLTRKTRFERVLRAHSTPRFSQMLPHGLPTTPGLLKRLRGLPMTPAPPQMPHGLPTPTSVPRMSHGLSTPPSVPQMARVLSRTDAVPLMARGPSTPASLLKMAHGLPSTPRLKLRLRSDCHARRDRIGST